MSESSALPAAAHRSEAVRYGAYMLRRFGWFYKLLGLGRILGRLRLDTFSVERIRAAAEKGPIVYVLFQRSNVEHLALNTVLNMRRLPLSVWANGVRAFYWQPVVPAYADLWRRIRALFKAGRPPEPITSGWLASTVASGAPVTVFLEDARWSWREDPPDPLAGVLAAQGLTNQPVQLVPIMVVWDRAPEVRRSVVREFLSGGAERRGHVARLRDLLFRSHEAFIQAGEPVDLVEFCERVPDPNQQVRALRTLLRRYLRRESQIVRGPRLLAYRDMKRLVLDNPPMRRLAQQEAEATGRSLDQVRKQMDKEYGVIAARFRWWVVGLLVILLRPVWTRVFAGVDVRDEDLEKIRAAIRNGSAVLVPSHKSHFDYMLLSWVLHSKEIIVPHIVAGVNLAIWPVSILLRGAGAFFIRRDFSGERIFPTVFARYLRELMRLGYPVEFFIEGGRTRSGKLLPPKLGVLGMVFDAAAVRAANTEVTLLPISVAYEQVAEAGVYARELAGEKKEAESLGQVVKARSVLGRRFGRCYVRVGEPLPLSGVLDPLDWRQMTRDDHKDVLQQAGETLIHRIGRCTVVLPTSLLALALLAHHRRGIQHSELMDRVKRFRGFLVAEGALEAASMERWSQAITQALTRLETTGLVESLDGAESRVWAVAVDKRITLEFYKNQILHYFTLAGFTALAARSLPDGPFTADQLRKPFIDLVWLLRREFILDPEVSASDQLLSGLDALVRYGALRRFDEGWDQPAWEVVDPLRMGEIYALFRNFLEAYALVLKQCPALTQKHSDARSIITALQHDEDTLLAEGSITRPEALSLVTLENAVRVFEEEGVMVRDQRGGLAVDTESQKRRLEELAPLFA